jgi:hypothetical protein
MPAKQWPASMGGMNELLGMLSRLVLREWAPGTARRNAWEAMCADAERARDRAEAASALAPRVTRPNAAAAARGRRVRTVTWLMPRAWAMSASESSSK